MGRGPGHRERRSRVHLAWRSPRASNVQDHELQSSRTGVDYYPWGLGQRGVEEETKTLSEFPSKNLSGRHPANPELQPLHRFRSTTKFLV